MNKLLKFFMFFTIPLLAGIMVSCGDDAPVVEPAVPSITAVDPAEGLPGTVVTITGTDLEDVTEVRFGTMDAEGFDPANNTATSLTATVPAGIAAGAQTITVVSPGGEDTFLFTVLEEEVEMPEITSFAPATGVVGDEVTVTGANLDLATSAFLGEVEIIDWAAAADGASATFTVPEGAVTGPIVLVTAAGDEIVSASDFTVETDGGGETGTIVDYNVVVYAQGLRNDEGVPTAFSADGQVFTLLEGVTEGASIDFIATDSGGDNELDLFSPSHTGWLEGNYFEDSEDQPVTWSARNETEMEILPASEVDFENITAEELMAMELGEAVTLRAEIQDTDRADNVILFVTAEGEKGLLRWTEHDPGADSKEDAFTFEIKVIE
ncbi:IPT/TIG domain-containing protein [Nafulsella turpanensis]|uniref:IPT/TIG domain-containing protein n=1 Tax=Nafulsella turpanensis TaxID=1265690 RepID=UPI000363D221|nr:IPT/TIG domain-containing protein [Nafulsella turpanensis]